MAVEHLENLRHFLLGQQIYLKVQVGSMTGLLRHSVLSYEHGDGQEQCMCTHDALKPEEWGPVDISPARAHAHPIDGNPENDKCHRGTKVRWTAEERADALDGDLHARELGVFALVEGRQDGQVRLL